MEARLEDAVTTAARLVSRRERTVQGLIAELERKGFPPAISAEAVARLAATGAVDDERAAASRARVLAERGSGDALIRADLAAKGVDVATIESAVAALTPERQRAADVVRRRGPGQATARYLARKGYGEDAVELALSADVADWPARA